MTGVPAADGPPSTPAGEDLGALLARTGALDPARAVDVVGQVARALDAVHAAGQAHGRLTTSAVWLADAGGPTGRDAVRLLGAGRPVPAGTEPDAAADVRALAAVLFEMLTGLPPTSPPAPPSSLRPDLPVDLDGVVLRGLAEDGAPGWTSAGGMAAAARAVLALHGIEVSRPVDLLAGGSGGVPASPAPAPSARRRLALVAGAALAAVGAAVLVRRGLAHRAPGVARR